MATLAELLAVAQTGSNVALLIFFVWAFYTGKIISRTNLDEIIKAYQDQTEAALERAVDKILKQIKGGGW